ncbi:MAG: DNA polymerase III subunit delta [Proteobacteria bacterium]|nr:MAG: DNA polymerase III subunit delta [Pseudomonadota bacterium]
MSYKAYQTQYQKALDPKHPEKSPLMVIKGSSDFMLNLTLNALKSLWQSQGWSVERIEGVSFTGEKFLQATSTRSMFEPQQITLVGQAFASNDLADNLKSLDSARSIQPALVLISSGEIPARFAKELTRLAAFTLSCDEPAPWEVKDFLLDRSRAHKLELNSEAQSLFLEAIGSDLAKVENELRKLALIFPDEKITGAAIKEHVDFLREDTAFKLDQFLCQEAYPQAMLLVKGLLDRGESSLGVLAILSMHCRKSLQIQAGLKAGQSPADISRELRLPTQVVQQYMPYLRKKNIAVFQRALNLCHDADRKLKSIRHGEETWLQRIVWELMA